MEPVLRSLAVYAFVLLVFRLSGKRTLAQMTPFDFVLLLIIGESTQQALLGNDFSLTNAFIVVTSLLTIEVGLSLLKQRSSFVDGMVEGYAVLLVDEGEVLHDRLRRTRTDVNDILEAARMSQGVDRLEDIRFAVLERSGGISVIPRR